MEMAFRFFEALPSVEFDLRLGAIMKCKKCAEEKQNYWEKVNVAQLNMAYN